MDDDETIQLVIRPVCSRGEFIDMLDEESELDECESLRFESVVAEQTKGFELIIRDSVVEAVEIPRPLENDV